MDKSSAIKLMEQGKKLTHRFFTNDEWVTMQDGKIVFEDGVKCSPLLFWSDRTSPYWGNDWDLFIEKSRVMCLYCKRSIDVCANNQCLEGKEWAG